MSQEEKKNVIYILNAFSPSMLSGEKAYIIAKRVSLDEAKQLIQNKTIVSYIGHEATSKFLSVLLGTEIPINRATLKLEPDPNGNPKLYQLLVLNLGVRLPEGLVINDPNELQKYPYQLYQFTVVYL